MTKEDKGLQPGVPIPNFTLESADGQTYSSAQFSGKPFLLYFLRGTW